jgi:hypothetical protein
MESYGYASNGNYALGKEVWDRSVAAHWGTTDTIGMLVDLDDLSLTFWKG